MGNGLIEIVLPGGLVAGRGGSLVVGVGDLAVARLRRVLLVRLALLLRRRFRRAVAQRAGHAEGELVEGGLVAQ